MTNAELEKAIRMLCEMVARNHTNTHKDASTMDSWEWEGHYYSTYHTLLKRCGLDPKGEKDD